jgi:hypothetical protein
MDAEDIEPLWAEQTFPAEPTDRTGIHSNRKAGCAIMPASSQPHNSGGKVWSGVGIATASMNAKSRAGRMTTTCPLASAGHSARTPAMTAPATASQRYSDTSVPAITTIAPRRVSAAHSNDLAPPAVAVIDHHEMRKRSEHGESGHVRLFDDHECGRKQHRHHDRGPHAPSEAREPSFPFTGRLHGDAHSRGCLESSKQEEIAIHEEAPSSRKVGKRE